MMYLDIGQEFCQFLKISDIFTLFGADLTFSSSFGHYTSANYNSMIVSSHFLVFIFK